MIFLFLFPLYLGVGFYMLMRVFHWTFSFAKPLNAKRFKIPFGIAYLLCMVSPIFASTLPKNAFTIIVRRISTYWMGVMLYMFMTLAVIDILRFVLKHTKRRNSVLFTSRALVIIGTVAAVILSCVCVYGHHNATNIKLNTYNVDVDKSCGDIKDLKIALVADLHLGYSIGEREMKQMAEKINAIEPDIVVIAGDIFDNSFDGLDDPDGIKKQLRSIKSKYGVFATYGNHDIEESILMGFTFDTGKIKKNSQQMDDFLKESNITLLKDESVLVDDRFYIVGRRDYARPSTDDGTRLSAAELTENIDTSKPVFFVDHEPSELQEIADAGADLDLSGHTHDGQIFPATIAVNFTWENPCGVIKKDSMYSIVTSGVGVFGPFMRVGTDSEICEVNVHFTK